jgi:hypothetical protein
VSGDLVDDPAADLGDLADDRRERVDARGDELVLDELRGVVAIGEQRRLPDLSGDGDAADELDGAARLGLADLDADVPTGARREAACGLLVHRDGDRAVCAFLDGEAPAAAEVDERDVGGEAPRAARARHDARVRRLPGVGGERDVAGAAAGDEADGADDAVADGRPDAGVGEDEDADEHGDGGEDAEVLDARLPLVAPQPLSRHVHRLLLIPAPSAPRCPRDGPSCVAPSGRRRRSRR